MTERIEAWARRVRRVLKDKKGEGYVDTGIKLLISVVIGSLLLTGLYALFSNNILPSVGQRIIDMFNYVP